MVGISKTGSLPAVHVYLSPGLNVVNYGLADRSSMLAGSCVACCAAAAPAVFFLGCCHVNNDDYVLLKRKKKKEEKKDAGAKQGAFSWCQ